MVGYDIIGVVAAVSGTFMTATGNIYLRKSALLKETDMPILQRSYWLFGTFMLVVPLTALNTVALALAPLSLLAPCAALTTVWSVWLVSCGCLGIFEEITRQDVASTLLVAVGIALVTSSRGDGMGAASVHSLTRHIASPYFLSAWVVTVACGSSIRFVKHLLSKRVAFISTALFAAACAACSQSFLKFMANGGAAYIRGEHVNVRILFLALIGLSTSPPLNLYLLGETIASGTVVVAVGTYEALVIVLTAGWGIFFFDELAAYGPVPILVLISGLLLTLVGVVVRYSPEARC